MEIVNKLMENGRNCSVDGSSTISRQNPFSRAVDSVLHNQIQPHRHQQHHHQISEIEAELQQSFHQQNNLPKHPQHQTHHDQAFTQQFLKDYSLHQQQEEDWARQFNQQQLPPPQQLHHKRFEDAFQQSQHPHPHHHHPMARMENCWQESHPHYHPPPQPHFASAWQDSKPPAMEHADTRTHNVIEEDLSESCGIKEASSLMAQTMADNPNPKFQQSEFLKFMNKVSDGNAVLTNDNKVVHLDGDEGGLKSSNGTMDSAWNESKPADGKFQEAWAEGNSAGVSLHHQGAQFDSAWEESEEKAFESAWEESKEEGFQSAWTDSKDPIDKINEENLEEIWQRAMKEAESGEDVFDEIWGQSATSLAEYDFQNENPYSSHANPFAKGMELFDAGNLPEAILCFEAEAQQNDGNSEAWRMLGECHAEQDDDKKAITCLHQALERDAYNLPALLGLGVSYVNELNPQSALKNLEAWVKHNPKFHGFSVVRDAYSDGSLMDDVMQLMLQASDFDNQDLDVQIVLGVLYNVSKDYDAAVRTFQLAVEQRPDDYTLWNKLGATLANSSRSDEAIPAYQHALELKPKYARGWLNLGISMANLGNYEKACKCYLQALTLNDQADHIWSYLRIAFTCLDRYDLVKQADTRDVSLFQQEFNLLQL